MKLIMESWRQHLSEQETVSPKVIFMAGAPGAGKSTVIDRLGLQTLDIINPDDFYEPMLDQAGLGKNIAKIKDDFKTARIKLKELLSQILQLQEPEDGWDHNTLEDLYVSASQESNGDKTFIYNLEKTMEDYESTRGKMSQMAILFNKARAAAKEKQQASIEAGESFIVDGTGGQFGVIRNQKDKLEELGYDVGMIFVDIPLETSLARQQSRLEQGGRSLDAKAVERSWNAVSKNREPYRELFGDNFFHILASEEDIESSIASEGEKLSAFLGALEEDFQTELKPRLIRQMKRLLRHGGNQDSGPFKEKAPIDYRGSAPPGAPGG
tara:strand:- start:4498 stop:5472 length:975 start_codon:yes stop_codon:yes gene_type:complete